MTQDHVDTAQKQSEKPFEKPFGTLSDQSSDTSTAPQVASVQSDLRVDLFNEQDTQRIAATIAQFFSSGILYLSGDLGAGKTTFTRFFLQALGHTGSVKSPTYTIVEPYLLPQGSIFHFDLYRLQDPYELELIGIRDYLDTPNALLIFEWPNKGEGEIPEANLTLHLRVVSAQTEQRELIISSDNHSLLRSIQNTI